MRGNTLPALPTREPALADKKRADWGCPTSPPTLSASSTSEVSRLAECASVRAISTVGVPATSAARRAAEGERGGRWSTARQDRAVYWHVRIERFAGTRVGRWMQLPKSAKPLACSWPRTGWMPSPPAVLALSPQQPWHLPAMMLRTACWVGTSTLPPRWPHFFSEDSWSSKCTAGQHCEKKRAGEEHSRQRWGRTGCRHSTCGEQTSLQLASPQSTTPCPLTASGTRLNQVLGQLVGVQRAAKASLCRSRWGEAPETADGCL